MRQIERSPSPELVRREREADQRLLRENLHILWPTAERNYAKQGRGAIVVVNTGQPLDGGYPFYYLGVAELIDLEETETAGMVKVYDPSWEMIAMVVKPALISTYRVGVPSARKDQSH